MLHEERSTLLLAFEQQQTVPSRLAANELRFVPPTIHIQMPSFRHARGEAKLHSA